MPLNETQITMIDRNTLLDHPDPSSDKHIPAPINHTLPTLSSQNPPGSKGFSYSSSYSSCLSSTDSDTDDDFEEYFTNDAYSTSTESSAQITTDEDIAYLVKSKRCMEADLLKLKTEATATEMDVKYLEMAIRAVDILATSPNYRIVIAIGGTPGSGKTTLSGKVVDLLNHYFQKHTARPSFNQASSPHQSLFKSSPVLSAFSENHLNDFRNGSVADHAGTTTATPTAQNTPQLDATSPIYGIAKPTNKMHDMLPAQAIPLSTSRTLTSNPHSFDDDDFSQQDLEDLDLDLAIGSIGNDFDRLSLSAEHVISDDDQVSISSASSMPTPFATTVTMDGYHLTRAQLDQFPDPKEAHKRRGAPWTFDAQGVVDMAKTLHDSCLPRSEMFEGRSSSDSQTLYFPAFDHALKDPTPNGISVDPFTRVVLIEGLYTLYNADPWNQIVNYVDDSWMIFVDLNVATTRLAKRHLAAGIVDTLEAGIDRVKTNDELNGRLILDNIVTPNVMINSISFNVD